MCPDAFGVVCTGVIAYEYDAGEARVDAFHHRKGPRKSTNQCDWILGCKLVQENALGVAVGIADDEFRGARLRGAPYCGIHLVGHLLSELLILESLWRQLISRHHSSHALHIDGYVNLKALLVLCCLRCRAASSGRRSHQRD